MKQYTIKDIEEMRAFFKGRKLPKTLDIDRCTKSVDLAKTVNVMLDNAEMSLKNKNMRANLVLLDTIIERLKEDER